MKNKKLIIRVILIIMIIIHCLVIFKFSSQKADSSSNTSGVIVNKIVEEIYKGKNINEQEKENLRERITTPIRKAAHFSIFAYLGLLLLLCLKTFEFDEKKRIIISWLLGIAYACTDEFHQFFVEGRSAEIVDVCIDSMGVLFGIIIVEIIYFIHKKK